MWTTNPQLISEIKMEYASDVKDSRIIVKLNDNQKGNAIVSLHNNTSTAPVLWSWHIWAPESDPTLGVNEYITELPQSPNQNIVNSTKSFMPPLKTTFMDRNLGALEKYPTVLSDELVKKSRGLQFQWGRKDPFPSLVSKAGENYIYLGSENASDIGSITYKSILEYEYKQEFSKRYADYGLRAANISKKIADNLRYSVQNPLVYLYQTGQGNAFDGDNMYSNILTNVKDWISDERAQAGDRWGHGTQKSVFDPCPEGWRVPDVSSVILYNGSKGTSPWYNSYQKDSYAKNGVIRNQWHRVVENYSGIYEKDFGWNLIPKLTR